MNRSAWVAIVLLGAVVAAMVRGSGPGWSREAPDRPDGPVQADVLERVSAACGSHNPYFVVTNLVYQAEEGQAGRRPAVVAFRDTLLDQGADNITLATHEQVGAVNGLAYDARRGQLYVGAYHKRASYFGPGGPGQVYRIDLATGVVSPFVSVAAGGDLHDPLRRNLDNDGAQYVGRVSLGDVEIDDGASELFVANLFNHRVHRYSLPDGTELPSFRNGADAEPWRLNARLFALAWREGWLYHGVVDSGESSSVDYTRLAVLYRSRADGSEMQEVLRFDLDYGRAVPWQRWRSALAPYTRTPIGQAMFADVEFDEQGNPILGLRDRVTDMLAVLAVNDARYGAGDVVVARPEGAGWRVVTAPEPYQDRTVVDEALWGGLAAFPGLDHVVGSALGPVDISTAGGLWLDNAAGGQWRRETVTDVSGGSTVAGSNGLGDVESLCARGTTLDEPARGTATAVAVTATAAAGTATAIATQTAAANEPIPLPTDYAAACGTDNPYLAGVCYDAQDWFASGYDWAAVVGFRDTPLDGPSDPPQLAWLASASDVGAVWGLAFRRAENALYASAFHKRLAQFGPAGPGAVYRIDVLGGGVEPFVVVPNPGGNRHSATVNLRDPDAAARDWAGKTSLGDLDVDEEQDEMFVVNLNDGRIYRFELPSGQPLGSFEHGAAREARNNDMRPFGLKFHQGKLYHGVVDSAQRSRNPANLAGRVYESDRDGANMRLVASFPLTYARGVARVQGVIGFPGVHEVPLEWLPWRDDDNDLSNLHAEMSLYPQPILADIEFAASGDMVIGVRDRHGDMTVARQVMNNQTVLEKPGLAVGDTLLGRWNGATWDVETPDATTEHFYDRSSLADESTLGALARITGFDLVVASSLLRGSANFATTSYGLEETVVWYTGASGARPRHELVCRLPQRALSRADELERWLVVSGDDVARGRHAGPVGRPPAPDRPQHNEYVPASNMGDLEELCGPLPPTVTPTTGPSPTPSATATVTATGTGTATATSTPTASRTPSPTVTPTPTRSVWTIYLPLAVRDSKCDPRYQHVDVVLVLDASYTMRDLTRAGRPKLEAAKEAARRFLGAMRFPGDQAAIVSFNVEAHVNSPLSDDRAALLASLQSIRNLEFTRIDLGLAAAHQLLLGSVRRGVNTPVVILLSDGRSNPYFSRQLALDEAEAIRRDGIGLYTIGLGQDAEHPDLRVMATTPGQYRYAPDGEDLVPIYESLVVEVPCPPSSWWPYR